MEKLASQTVQEQAPKQERHWLTRICKKKISSHWGIHMMNFKQSWTMMLSPTKPLHITWRHCLRNPRWVVWVFLKQISLAWEIKHWTAKIQDLSHTDKSILNFLVVLWQSQEMLLLVVNHHQASWAQPLNRDPWDLFHINQKTYRLEVHTTIQRLNQIQHSKDYKSCMNIQNRLNLNTLTHWKMGTKISRGKPNINYHFCFERVNLT